MDEEQKIETINKEEIFVDDPQFYARAFSFACKQRKIFYARDGDNFRRVAAEEYNELSKRLDLTKIQESCSVRNVLRTRRLANLLVSDNGEILFSVLPRLIAHLTVHLHALGPNRQYDSKRQLHLLNVLTLLNDNKEIARLVRNIDKPVSHKHAEQIIRDTLLLPPNVPITDAHARRAVLSAWMCTLRQNVGSCFATAPAIIIHQEQPELFLKDISELLNTGRLKRTFGGVEYSVPLSASWGAGDLKKPFFVSLGENFDKNYLWLSPGLIAAFGSANLLDPDAPSEVVFEKSKSIIQDVLNTLEWKQPLALMTAEEIIRKALLHKQGLTEKDIQDYENRPKDMVHSSLLMHVARPGISSGGKGELAASFLTQFSTACNAFKALADNALLKAWEFTLASFAETKAQFTRWNLYSSLGLGPDEKGGIGATLYEVIKRKLDQANQRVQDFQYEYENMFHQLKTLEARARSVSSEKEAQWLRAEYQTKRNEFYTLEEIRDEIHHKAKRLANLYNDLIEKYDELFPRYFQEVYDADMHDVSTGPYDDSPAGFRLLYKYGRSNTSQWSLIKTPGEFIDALASFFTATENEIAASQELEGLQSDLAEIVTAVINQIRTKEFLETAFYRMAAAHKTRIIKDPLEHLELIDKKPWAYTSGGTMGTLVSCYYKQESPPTEVSRWVESPTELLVFLIDSLKQLPPNIMDDFIQNPQRSMLMHSPTHAFLLKPGIRPFKDAWQTESYTYTWVRDTIVSPRKDFINGMLLDEEKMNFLVRQLVLSVPDNYRYYFLKVFEHMYAPMTPTEFREHILKGIQKERGLKQAGGVVLTEEEIDRTLYTLLPMFPLPELRQRVADLFEIIPSLNQEQRDQLIQTFDMASRAFPQQSMIDAETFQGICKGLLCLTFEETTSEVDYHDLVSKAAQQLGYAMPAPILFADTNWVKEEFGFVVNPGSGDFELWRVDHIGRIGAPMTHWEQWLNGSRKDIHWGIYTKPYEYSAPTKILTH
jgi:hypothetical protein